MASPNEKEEQHLRLCNVLANGTLNIGALSQDPDKVIVYAVFDRQELEARTGMSIPGA